MTFCNFYETCSAHNCFRALTPRVKESAEKLGLLVSMFVDKPECYKEDE